jgi:hypothetical protein
MTYLKYLKYKNKYLMLKNMIGGNLYNFTYLNTYRPTKLENIDYKIISDGLTISFSNPQGYDETVNLDSIHINHWLQKIFSKYTYSKNDFNNFFDQLFTMDKDFFELVKKVALSEKLDKTDEEKIHQNLKIVEDKITEERTKKIQEDINRKETEFNKFLNDFKPSIIKIGHWEKKNTIYFALKNLNRNDFKKKTLYEQTNTLNLIFSWNVDAYNLFKRKLLGDNGLDPQLDDLSNTVQVEGKKEEDDYQRKLVEEDKVIQKKAREYKKLFDEYTPKKLFDEYTPKIHCDKACVVAKLLSFPNARTGSTLLNIKIPDFINQNEEDLKKLKELLDNLNQIGIADNYKLIVKNLYEIDDLYKKDDFVVKDKSKFRFPEVEGWRMDYCDKKYNVNYGFHIIENLRKIQEVLQSEIDIKCKPSEECTILNAWNGFIYEKF